MSHRTSRYGFYARGGQVFRRRGTVSRVSSIRASGLIYCRIKVDRHGLRVPIDLAEPATKGTTPRRGTAVVL